MDADHTGTIGSIITGYEYLNIEIHYITLLLYTTADHKILNWNICQCSNSAVE